MLAWPWAENSASGPTNRVPSFLLRALRIVIRADSDPARQALFANLKQTHLAVRVVYGVHEMLARTPAAGLLVSSYGLADFLRIVPPAATGARILSVARHANAKRHVARVVSWLEPGECAAVNTGISGGVIASGVATLLTASFRRGLVRALRIIRRVDRRYGFLVACRVASGIAWYVRSTAMLTTHKPDAVLVSSDSNPEELGFAAAARALHIPTVFVAHAYTTPLSPPLDFSLSILEGEAAVRARRKKGPIKGAVVLAGLEGESAPLDAARFARPTPVVGIFTPKAVSWPRFAQIVDDCRAHFSARQIVIRWHPSMLERPHLAEHIGDTTGIVETSPAEELTTVARQCDWVIADENSGVHLPVLKLGIPTIAVKNMGLYPPSRSDLYGFAAEGVVYPPVSSIREITPDALTAFFSGGWSAKFQHFDASYLRPPHAVGGDVRSAIWRLFEAEPAEVTVA
jgi:hypothetical protein